MGVSCYDGGQCINWHSCEGSCRVREKAERLRSQAFEDAPTQRTRYTGEETEVIDTGSVADILRDTPSSFISQNDSTQVFSNVEPETMSYNVFEFRPELSLAEEEVTALRDRFLATRNRVSEMWTPSLPPQVEAHSEYTRTYPKHRCFVCWLVSKLPSHHRCPHGRLVCEQCEAEAAGW